MQIRTLYPEAWWVLLVFAALLALTWAAPVGRRGKGRVPDGRHARGAGPMGTVTNRVRGVTAAVGVWVSLTAVLSLSPQLQQWSHLLAGGLIALAGVLLARRWEWDGAVAAPAGVWLLIAGITRGGHAGLPIAWINVPAGVLVSGASVAAMLGINVPWADGPSRSP